MGRKISYRHQIMGGGKLSTIGEKNWADGMDFMIFLYFCVGKEIQRNNSTLFYGKDFERGCP